MIAVIRAVQPIADTAAGLGQRIHGGFPLHSDGVVFLTTGIADHCRLWFGAADDAITRRSCPERRYKQIAAARQALQRRGGDPGPAAALRYCGICGRQPGRAAPGAAPVRARRRPASPRRASAGIFSLAACMPRHLTSAGITARLKSRQRSSAGLHVWQRLQSHGTEVSGASSGLWVVADHACGIANADLCPPSIAGSTL